MRANPQVIAQALLNIPLSVNPAVPASSDRASTHLCRPCC